MIYRELEDLAQEHRRMSTGERGIVKTCRDPDGSQPTGSRCFAAEAEKGQRAEPWLTRADPFAQEHLQEPTIVLPAQRPFVITVLID